MKPPPPSTALRRRLRARVAALAAALALAVPTGAEALDPARFPLPAELEPNVDFWTRVYTEYDSHHVLLHDDVYLYVVYAVLDFTPLDASNLSDARKIERRRDEIRKARNRYRQLLEDSAAGRVSKTDPEEQARIETLLAPVPGGRGKYAAAAARLRIQTCLKDHFAEAIERSGVYMAAIEEIFSARGLPVELTRLPFVESMFQWQARSAVAAAGIWQFMPSTARLYRLEMGLELDQRYDPLAASEAAARHLEDNYEALGTWPLAITAYNHGPAGVRRAVRRLGTRDLGEIASHYRSRSFGFASRNFYSEFVAAARIYAERERHFPGVEPAEALAFDQLALERYVPIADLAKGAGTGLEVLRQMNPALSKAVWAGHVYLPARYLLRVPAGRGAAFEAAYAALPDDRKSPHQVGTYYRVRRGDTLSRIAEKFGTSAAALQRANRLRSVHRIHVGQRLLIPPGRGGVRAASGRGADAAGVVAQSTAGVHTVRRGETLSGIAEAYGTSVRALQAANRLANADSLHVGQRLTIPNGGKTTHVVRSGETLAGIARRYGTTVRALKSANRIRSHLIRPSQVLVIP